MVTKNKNFCEQTTPSIVDTEYEKCNFAFKEPVDDGGTMIGNRIFPGDDTPRTFIRCNMRNVEPPPGSTCTKCMSVIRKNQVHVRTEQVILDGIAIDVKSYAHLIYGSYKDGTYVYHPTPIEHPCDPPEE